MKTNQLIIAIILITGLLTVCQACQSSQSNSHTATTELPLLPWCPPMDQLAIYTQEEDIQIFENVILEFENAVSLHQEPSVLITSLARYFLQTPYVASTLEIPEEEQLVINLREMDCTTFVEYILAFNFTLLQPNRDFDSFSQILTCIRYRDGVMNGYPSRLHYFTEWLQNNAQKGILELVSDKIGTVSFDPTANFMSKNTQLYRQLSNPAYTEQIIEAEKVVSGYQMKYITKDQIINVEDQIKDGDIIAFTTNIAGLDVSHTGFALHQDGRLHLIHASTRTNQSEITPVPLSEYLQPMNRVTGILVARVLSK